MKQPVRGGKPVKRKKKVAKPRNKAHKEYGTSKLEVFFAENYLNKLGLTYVYEFEVKEIGRFYDFAIIADDSTLLKEERNGIMSVNDKTRVLDPLFMIEIDGSFFHSDPRVVDTKNLSPMQKRNIRVDGLKNRWCGEHHIPLLRVWEYDIYNDPELVRKKLAEFAVKYAKKYIKAKRQPKKKKSAVKKKV